MSPAMQRGHLFGGSGAFVVVGAHVAQAAEAQTVAAYTFVARSGATTTDVESKQLSVLGA